ncbi:hypothetical protein AVB38_23585 [Salmonella enterica subsp. enterica serovar Bredeney]|nr:hypothetical protein [Salmonella enterica subsp. enterica serovar Bredeney]
MPTAAERRVMADRHLTEQPPHIAAQQHSEAMQYINGIQKSILKELDKLEDEYTEQMEKVKGNQRAVEAIERNYIHWRHILVSVFEPLNDAKEHWNHHTGLTDKQPRHTGKF